MSLSNLTNVLQGLIECGYNVFPGLDLTEGDTVKDHAMEAAIYHQMALLSARNSFVESVWNREAGPKSIVLRAGVNQSTEPLSRVCFHLIRPVAHVAHRINT